MRIGLIDADLMLRPRANGRRYGHTKADIYPNLAMMKLSAWHKMRGDEVEWYMPFGERYDRVYISKVFSDTPDPIEVLNADEVIRGGSGYAIQMENGIEVWKEPTDNGYSHRLLPEIEHMYPDYSIYGMIKDTAYGFLSRGCPRGCHFCHVARKEGRASYKVADLHEWWHGQKLIVLMDPNILACKSWKSLLQQLIDSNAWVDINQGIDARLLNETKVEMLSRIKLKTIHFAWDDYRQKKQVLRGLKLWAEKYPKFSARGRQNQVFVLVNYDTTFEQDLERIYTLRDMGYMPYVMIYDKPHADKKYKSLQRWVNMRAIFAKIPTFEEYDSKKARE